MLKKLFTAACMLSTLTGFAIDKVDPKYWVEYGDANAPVKVIEYYSVDCSECLYRFYKEFDYIKRRYINSGEIQWIFHPSPADLPTLQAMICLEQLKGSDKQRFLEELLPKLQGKSTENQTMVLKQLAQRFRIDFPSREQEEALKKTEAFQNAYKFISQKGGVELVPTVEINGELLEDLPTATFIDHYMMRRAREKK